MTMQEDDFFKVIVTANIDAIIAVNMEGIVRYMNPAAERLFDRPAEGTVGEMFGFPIKSDKPQELQILRPGKDSRVVEMRVATAKLVDESVYVASLSDITDISRLRDELRTISFIDELTGLYNRRGFLSFAKNELKLAKRYRREMTLFSMDLDGLKGINDTLGHNYGDMALVETASVLKEIFRESDIIGRMGGDEFVVLAIESPRAHEKFITTRLREKQIAHNTQENRRYTLSLSVGMAYYDTENLHSIEELIERADASMYENKRKKRQIIFGKT